MLLTNIAEISKLSLALVEDILYTMILSSYKFDLHHKVYSNFKLPASTKYVKYVTLIIH